MIVHMERDSIAELNDADIKKLIDEQASADLKYDRLQEYYEGKHAILQTSKKDTTAPNNRLVHNVPKYITNSFVGCFVGKPVVYASQNDELMAWLQNIFDYNDEQAHNAELAKCCSIGGGCFEMLYLDEDAEIRFAKVPPYQGIMICATGEDVPLLFIRIIHSRDKNDNKIDRMEVWDAAVCRYYISKNGGNFHLYDEQPHYWQDVPFVYYGNNEEGVGDFEDVISLVDAYNLVQSNTANLFQYNDNAILKISRLGDVTSQNIRDMKELGAIILEDGGDIEWLIKELNDSALENYKNRLWRDMHIFGGVPDLSDENFGNNSSGVALAYKFSAMEQICAVKERKFKRSLQRRIELICNMLQVIRGAACDWREVDIKFRRNKPQNMLETAQIVQMLADILSKESRLQLLPNVDNPQDELERLQTEQAAEVSAFGGGESSGYNMLAEALAAAEATSEEDKL